MIDGIDNPKQRVAVAQSLCWGTHQEAHLLGVEGQGTRHWAYRWIEEHLKSIGSVKTISDLGGGGIDSYLANLIHCYADRILVLDKTGTSKKKDNIQQIVVDMEEGLGNVVEDNSIDVYISASAIEHMSSKGQAQLFSEMERTLKPGGIFCGTISYISRLTPELISLIQSDPAFEMTGSAVLAPFDAKRCLEAAPGLKPLLPPKDLSLFPGFEGFDENNLLKDESLVFDYIRSYGDVTIRPEIESMNIKWFEMGMFLQKIS